MEASVRRVLPLFFLLPTLGASSRSTNFIVTAPTPSLAHEICQTAERCRRDLAQEWLGRELPSWRQPCPIVARVAESGLGAGGVTSFMFDRGGHPYGWQMSVQGSRQRVLDSVIPHEVTHTIFATHFGQPLPRWADEGACTAVEHVSEKSRHQQMLLQFLTSGQGIAFNRMFAMREYPTNMLPLYSQGYSVARYLIEQRGKQRFVRYIEDGLQTNNWTAATNKHYGVSSLGTLQGDWLTWVKQGSPSLQPDSSSSSDDQLASLPRSDPRVDSATSPNRLSPATDANDRSGGDSWYARQRDHAAVVKPLTAVSSDDSRESTRLIQPGKLPSARATSRPQPLQQPRQRILEWNATPRPQVVPAG